MFRSLWYVHCIGGLLLSASVRAAGPALTIYNSGFAVVRESIPLELKPGVNDVTFEGATAHVEPDSVILRDPTGKVRFRIMEQSYRADPASTERLLEAFEGKTIDFWIRDAKTNPVPGRILRAGSKVFDPNEYDEWGRRGNAQQMEPIVEIEGSVRMGLPGEPIFPRLPAGTPLKPSLRWRLAATEPAKCVAELAYLTGAMSWEADYNVVLDAAGDRCDFIGWVTVDNFTGKVFPEARIKLLAGDVRKERRSPRNRMQAVAVGGGAPDSRVSERKFDEYHLYAIEDPTTLHDREQKQVELVRSLRLTMPAGPQYVYDGAGLPEDWEDKRYDTNLGEESTTKVAVYRDVVNRKENGLGIPLPKGMVRFYRRDRDGQLEFIGEDRIPHTPAGETLRLRTGNAFDLLGVRTRTEYTQVGSNRLRESFQIKLRNRSDKPVEILVVEHLVRGTWEITESSQKYSKRDGETIEFAVPVASGGEKEVTYTVQYYW